MKLETTLEERPGFLHALPLFDLFALITMLLLLGPMLLTQGGVVVELPATRFQMQRFQESIVVTLGPGGAGARLHLGRKAVTVDELRDELGQLKSDETMARSIVLFKADVGATVGMERRISEIILESGFRMALVGQGSEADDSLIEEGGDQ